MDLSDLSEIQALILALKNAGDYALIAIGLFLFHKLAQLASILMFAKFCVSKISEHIKMQTDIESKRLEAEYIKNPKYVPHRGDVGL
jgi:hypothetical protein